MIYQEFLLDPSVSVQQLLVETETEIIDFARFEVGENLDEEPTIESIQTCGWNRFQYLWRVIMRYFDYISHFPLIIIFMIIHDDDSYYFYYKIEKESKKKDCYMKSNSHNFVVDSKCPNEKNRKILNRITMYSMSCIIKSIIS